ncbi:P-loop containing nucleoside triphosphate hydrolase protein [Baffinella frigidus]|nr:P-loop containing nucleoside triphosphate hydrolase protein [Cryptophyta sp. CCMP2293]
MAGPSVVGKATLITFPSPLVMAGPSAVGKATLIARLFRELPGVFSIPVSHTTRQRLSKEVDGVDFRYVTRDEMEEGMRDGAFLEVAEATACVSNASI